METRILRVIDAQRRQEMIRAAGRALAEGQLVIFPTETVYGIGASAVHAGAIEALSRLKDRTPDKPFILHLADPSEAERYAGPLPELAQRLIHKTWPGPLTLVVPDRRPDRTQPPGLISGAIYYDGTVGLRCPRSDVGRAILRAAGVPVVGSSANLSGRAPPYQLLEALVDLDGKVPLAIDAGPSPLARPSTVVRVDSDNSYEVLREGALTARRVQRLVRTSVVLICSGNLCRSPMAEGLLRKMLSDRVGCPPEALEDHGIEVSSAGTGALAGYPASTHAVEVMEERGVDVTQHRSRPITVDALLAADYIWVMARHHEEWVRRLAPETAERVALLDPTGEDVSDPVGGDIDAYRACARHLETALAARLTEIV
jgi:protein-tyrosine phosphatase